MNTMEWLKSTFVDDPAYVYVGLGVAMLVLGVIWHRRRGPRWLAATLAMPVLALAVFIIGRTVVTDRQVIDRQCQEIAQDLSAGKFDAAQRYLDDDFGGGIWPTKSLAIDAGAMAIKHFEVGKVSLQHLQTKVDNKHAVTTVRTMINVRAYDGTWPMDWELHWVKKTQGWRIVEATYTKSQIMGQ
jgi:hypothetical protein